MYLAVVLDEKSSKELESCIPSDFREWKVYCHHMTICMGSNSKGKYNWEVGEEVELEVVSMGKTGWKGGALAAMVRIPEGKRIKNAIPHVTMAVDVDNGGKPVMSNKIKDWQGPIRKGGLTVRGIVSLCK